MSSVGEDVEGSLYTVGGDTGGRTTAEASKSGSDDNTRSPCGTLQPCPWHRPERKEARPPGHGHP